jgi:hypothetical protein
MSKPKSTPWDKLNEAIASAQTASGPVPEEVARVVAELERAGTALAGEAEMPKKKRAKGAESGSETSMQRARLRAVLEWLPVSNNPFSPNYETDAMREVRVARERAEGLRREAEKDAEIQRLRDAKRRPVNPAKIALAATTRQDFLRPLLKKKKWSVNQLAERSTVGATSTYEYWNGKRELSKANRKKIADILDINESQLPK